MRKGRRVEEATAALRLEAPGKTTGATEEATEEEARAEGAMEEGATEEGATEEGARAEGARAEGATEEATPPVRWAAPGTAGAARAVVGRVAGS